jgi:hypothetical protein
MPKVASTFLQQEVFPKMKDVKFYKKHHFNKYQELNNSDLNGKYLFSSEKDRGMVEEAKKINKKFPNAQIILLFRKHQDWILSRYKYYIRKHGYKPFHKFIDIEKNKGLWKTEELQYRKKIKSIEAIFGSQPHVFLFKDLKSKPDKFVKELLDITNTTEIEEINAHKRVNKAFSKKQLIVLRKYNEYYRFNEPKDKARWVRKVYKKYREFLLHIVAFISQAIPWKLLPREDLLSDRDLDTLYKMNDYYKEDWEFCLEYARSMSN